MGSRPHGKCARLVIEVPPGVRLAFEHRGELLPVRVKDGLAVTAAGEFPRREAARRRRKGDEDLGLFALVKKKLPAEAPGPSGTAPAVLVLFAPGRQDNAHAVANALWRAGYETEVRPDPEAA